MIAPSPPPSAAPTLLPHAAFVVQFAAGTDLAAGAAVGRIEHVPTGQAARFASVDDLLAFVRRALGNQPAG